MSTCLFVCGYSAVTDGSDDDGDHMDGLQARLMALRMPDAPTGNLHHGVDTVLTQPARPFKE
jgi:hypothetical protein